ncbi:transcriptional regulator [Streptomyces montanisoli]|uniref:Helix-turn-helix domain-containing protein n=1 Tax=Streptomyces montanisoli TaxID=2798581 RepID=A0A940MHN3_9ACTN|nr:transcriptional regulator [Streptomyces montanisoli]MBP0461023.1 helix-turn-helix domain-containing protein [Streptomyces montanisoli]
MTQSTTRSTPSPGTPPVPPMPSLPPTPPPEERRRLREAKPMTVKQLAAAVRVTQATVRGWETGRAQPRGRKGEQYLRMLAVFAEEDAAVQAAEEAAEAGLSADEHPVGAIDGSADGKRGGGEQQQQQPTDAPEGRDAPEGNTERPHGAVPNSPDSPDAPDSQDTSDTSDSSAPLTPEQAFDALYAYASPALVRQAYLLTGRRALARESVERAFQRAWRHWPEVAVDRDPASWVRAAVHEYALSPWHRMRPLRSAGVAQPVPAIAPVPVPGGRTLRETLLELPPTYRRAALLYDGLGLDLPDAAAESQASTPATGNRVLHAREAIVEHLPELADPGLLHDRLDALTRSVPVPPMAPAPVVRKSGERRVKLWTRAAIVVTALIVGATAYTFHTAPRKYESPEAPPQRVTGVPVPGAPPALTPKDKKLRDALDTAPLNGPERLTPRLP